jgi:hypothetical protein
MSRPNIIAAKRLGRLVRPEELSVVSRKASVRCLSAERHVRHRGAQYAGSDRVTLGVVGIQEAFWGCPVHYLGQLPSQIHRILHAGLQALSTIRGMRVRRRRPAGPACRGRPRPAGSYR